MINTIIQSFKRRKVSKNVENLNKLGLVHNLEIGWFFTHAGERFIKDLRRANKHTYGYSEEIDERDSWKDVITRLEVQ